ncbi:hypothetical protein C8J57DRAFT_1504867 [Mycena rebaudengoi]|nr:hypothetical protein C8J57DRAFT_1504867 [Mycena rebaudengoi]
MTPIYQSFSPRLHAYSENAVELIFDHNSELRHVYPGAFSTVEFHLGSLESPPRLHDRDFLHGWRAITSFSKYDSCFGGDLILWDEGLVIRFPVGATVLFPAALMCYSFCAVKEGETHYTFSQYTPGGLLRYIENDYRCDADLEEFARYREKERLHERRERRLGAAIKMYSTFGEYV